MFVSDITDISTTSYFQFGFLENDVFRKVRVHDHPYASTSIRYTNPHTGGGEGAEEVGWRSQPTCWTNYFSNRAF